MSGVEEIASIKFEGLTELLKKLDSAKGKTEAKAALRSGLRAGAQIIKTEIRSRTPVDTGAMKKSITIKAPRKNDIYKDSVRLMVSVRKFYARFLEYGTARHEDRRFVRDALKASSKAASEKAAEKIKAEVEKRLSK